jgi:hypothetical protein
MAVFLTRSEPGMGRGVKWPKRKCRFQQKYQEIEPFNNGGWGASITITSGLLIC